MNKSQSFLHKIAQAFPQIKWKTTKFYTHGWDHLVVVLDQKLIFRTPKRLTVSARQVLENESTLLKYLKKRVPVGLPNYHLTSPDYSIVGYTMLPGEELSPSRFRKLKKIQKDKIAKKIANFLTTLHQTPPSMLQKINAQPEAAEKNFHKLKSNIQKIIFPRFNKSEKQITNAFLAKLSAAIKQDHAHVLMHNDLTSNHILWDDQGQQISILDFSDYAIGDPAQDFAGLLDYGLGFTRQVLQHYHGPKDPQLIDRAIIYRQRMAFALMVDSALGYPCNFEDGYKEFKKLASNEPWSAITHLVGALLSVAALVLMVVFGSLYGTVEHIIGFSIFGATLILLYTFSTIYHFSRKHTRSKEILRRLDHAMIFLLIAGTYTPLCLTIPQRAWGWSLFGIIWGLATLGFIFKTTGIHLHRGLSTAIYLLMGWLVLVAFYPVTNWLTPTAIFWLLLGGLFYSLGCVFFTLEHKVQKSYQFGMHEIWHILVILGSFSHFWLMLKYISFS